MKIKRWLSIFLSVLLALQIALPSNLVQAIEVMPDGLPVVLVGDLQTELGNASDWDPASTVTQMTSIEGTSWYYFKGVLPAGSYAYKVAMGSWSESYGQFKYGTGSYAGGDNYGMTLAGNQEVLFMYDSNSHKIEVVSDNSLATVENVTIAGNMNGWNKEDSTMVMNYLGSGYYAKEVHLAAGNYEYKAVLANNWDSAVGVNGGNETFSLAEEGDVLFVFDAMSMKNSHYVAQVGTRTATVVGSLQTALGSASNWAPTEDATLMNDYGNGFYYYEGQLVAGNYDFKIAMNHDWAESYYGDNTGISVATDQQVAFIFNDTTKTIFTSLGRSLTLAGSLQSELGETADWKADSTVTKLVDRNGLSVFVGDVPKGDYEYKFAVNGNWTKNYGQDGWHNGSNILLSATDGKEFFMAREDVFNLDENRLTYKSISSPTAIESPVKNADGSFTFNVKKDNPSYDATKGSLNIIGSFVGWDTSKQIPLTDSGKGYFTTTLNFSTFGITSGAIEYKFKYTDTWDASFSDALNPSSSNGNSVLVVGNVPDTTTYHLTGSFQGWSAGSADYLMTDEDGDGVYTITLPLASANYEYKVTKKKKGAITWIPDGTGNNHMAKVTKAGNVTFYFNANLYEAGTNMNPVASSLDMNFVKVFLKDANSDHIYGLMTDENFDGAYEYGFDQLAAGTYDFEIVDADGKVYAADMSPYHVTLAEAFDLDISYQSANDYMMDNYAAAIDNTLDASQIVHNSWDKNDRAPFGAMPVGTDVSLKLRTAKGDASEVTAVVNGRPYPMTRTLSDASDV